MKRIKSLNTYQKAILIFMIAMTLVFAVVYARTISRVGFEYKGAILVPSQENTKTLYTGTIQGQPAQFTVAEDKTVVFQHGDKTYGPYTAKEDPTAIPKDEEMAEDMTGLELRLGEDILFRGGVLKIDDVYWLYDEDGSLENFGLPYIADDVVAWDENGKVIDSVEPSVSTILDLMNDPEMTHKGAWFAFLIGVFICLMNAISILFIDELFRWNLSFKIRNTDRAEPSDWEIAGRYITWTILTGLALVVFILGLQYHNI